MGKSGVKYAITLVHAGGRVTMKWSKGAPGDSLLASLAKGAGAQMAIRYFPSKKAWAVLDCRKAIKSASPQMAFYVGMVRLPKYYPSLDAAIMVAIHYLQRQKEFDYA